MIVVGNTIVSDDIADRRFCCDCSVCRGACCVEGDSGAPLLEEEVPILESILPEVMPFMTPEGRSAVEVQGVAVRDHDGDLGTPLVNGGACAYAIQEAGVTLCAIEKAYLKHRIQHSEFRKPVSCHLYPIRVEDYGEFAAVNYHQWDICRPLPIAHSQRPALYIYLKEPLVRRFGQEWYDELIQEIHKRNEQQQ